MPTFALFALTVLTLFGGALSAQSTETGFLNRTATAAGQSYRYQVYVPAGYTADTAWPVILLDRKSVV